MTAGSEEPNAIVQVGNDNTAYTEPNVRATEIEIYEGLETSSQNCWPSVNFDIGGINNVHVSFSCRQVFTTRLLCGRLVFGKNMNMFIRHSAGLGKSPTSCRSRHI